MSQRGHEVDLFTLADDTADLAHTKSLRSYCRQVTVRPINRMLARIRSAGYLLTRHPLTLSYFYSADLDTAFEASMRNTDYDRIFIYCSAMAQYVRRPGGIPVITDLVDVDSDKWRQYAEYASFPMSRVYAREADRLAEYERSVCLQSTVTLVTTEREARLLKAICDSSRIRVMRNGVGPESRAGAERAAEPTVIFSGDMAYFPNAQAVDYFARQVLPAVRRLVPDTRFVIAGRNPHRMVRRLASIPGVEITGTVPDIDPYLRKASVSVAPFLISAGIPNKILEALNSGLPVVATSRAAQGLTEDVARAIAIADTAETMASTIAILLRSPDLARRAGDEGRRCVAAAYSWDRSLTEFLDLIENPFAISQPANSSLA
jgi:sugar transferase (PEP-CTERM/EpsH1 system associated)